MYPYSSTDDALNDVLRLSRGVAGGPVGQYVLAVVVALVVSMVWYFTLLCHVQRLYLSTFFMLFVLHPLLLFILAGNLLFIHQQTYIIKLSLAVLALLTELMIMPRLFGYRHHRPLIRFGSPG